MKTSIKIKVQKLIAYGLCLAMILSVMPISSVKAQEVDPHAKEWTEEDLLSFANGTLSLCEQVDFEDSMSNESSIPVMFARSFSLSNTEGIPATTIGGASNPFKIGNVTVLQELATLVSSGKTYGNNYSYADAHYEMVADIDVSEMDWAPIGAADNAFKGSFQGGTYTIAMRGDDYTADEGTAHGLFGVVADNAQISVTVFDATHWTHYAAESFAGGAGSESNPYQIATAEQLTKLAVLVNNGSNESGKYYKLTSNIDLSAHEWVAIGTEVSWDDIRAFSGTFDGNGMTITGLYIDSTSNYEGLFGYASGATIQNVNVSGTIKGVSSVGGIAGYHEDGMISDCSFAGSISGSSNVGGIAGYHYANDDKYSEITKCHNTASVSGSGSVGGIAGFNFSPQGTITVSYCYNTGGIDGTYNVGGMVGWNTTDRSNTAIVEYCYNIGAVHGTNSVGGVIGYSFAGDIGQTKVAYCVALCASVTGEYSVGRVVGCNEQNGGTAECTNNYAWSSMTCKFEGENVVNGDVLGYSVSDGFLAPKQVGGYLVDSWNIIFGSEGYSNYWTGNGTTLPNGEPVPSYITAGHTSEEPTTPANNLWTSYATEFASTKDGNSEATAIEITTAEELAYLAKKVKDGDTYEGKYFKLTNDIDLSAHEWVPIGSKSIRFMGGFNGNGRTISGMSIKTSGEVINDECQVGLFGSVLTAKLENLNVTGNISCSVNVDSSIFAGGLAGYSQQSIVNNCGSNVAITISGGKAYSGGLIGYVNGKECTIKTSYAIGTVHATTNDTNMSVANVGGLIGNNQMGAIENCYATGNVSASGVVVADGDFNYAGGLIGNQYGGSVQNCYATGNVSGVNAAGGLVGYLYGSGKVEHGVSLSNTITGSGENTGRVIGYSDDSNTLNNLYAWSGAIDGGNNKATDGIDGADLYYSSSDGFSLDGGSIFEWKKICPNSDWTIPTNKYQLPYIQNVSKEIPQNPLANLEFVTVTFDDTDDKVVTIEYGSTLSEGDMPEGTWGTVDENTGVISEVTTETVFYNNMTLRKVAAEASVTTSESKITKYDTLEHAVSAATASDTISLLHDVELEKEIIITGTLTTSDFDINGTVNMQGTMKVSGKPVITEVKLATGKSITVTEALTEGADIGISTVDVAVDGTPVDVATGTNLNVAYFHKVDETAAGTLTLNTDNTKIQLFVPHSHTWVYTQGTKANPENSEETIEDPSKIKATCSAGACSGKHTTAELSIAATNAVYNETSYDSVTVIDSSKIQGEEKIQYEGVSSTVYTKCETAPTDAGNYKASITLGDVTAEATFEITPATMSGITAVAYNENYDGLEHGITVSGVPDGATVQYGTSEDSCNKDSIKYKDVTNETTIYYKVSKANYKDVTGSATVTISKAPLTVKVKEGQTITKTYDGTVAVSDTVVLEVEGLQNEETVTASGTCTYQNTNVGTGITIDIESISLTYGTTDENNYSYTPANLTTTGAITKAESTGTIGTGDTYIEDGDTITYGDKVTIAYTPTKKPVENGILAKISNAVTNLLSDDAASKTVELWYGDNKITLENTLTNVTENHEMFIVFPVNKTNFSTASDFDGSTKRTFTIKWGGDDNLKPSTTTLELILAKKTIDEVSVDATSETCTKVYNGKNQTFEDVVLTSTDVETNDKVSLTTEYTTSHANVANYNVEGTVAKTGTDAAYYQFSDSMTLSGSVSITPKDVTKASGVKTAFITEGNVSFIEPTFKDENDEDITGAVTKYTYDSKEYSSYDDLITKLNTVEVENSADTISVSYEFTAKDNYKGTITGAITMTVYKIKFTGDITTTTAIYGNTWNDILKFTQDTYNATLNGETLTGIYTLKIGDVYDSTMIPTAGKYHWAVTFTTNDNMHKDLKVDSGEITVNPLTATYSWDQTTFEYDSTEKLPTPTITNKVGDDDVKVTATGAKTDAGNSYTATAVLEGTDAGNYALPSTDANTTFEITPIKATGTISMTVADNGDTPLKEKDIITIEYAATLGETPTYQWYDENDTAIAGATDASYTIPEGEISGSYYCVVTLDGNIEGSFTSEKIQIGTTKPNFTKFTVENGNGTATLNWSLDNNSSKIMEYSLEVKSIKETKTTDETTGEIIITSEEESVSGSPFTIAAGATSHTVTGLTNGTKYTFKLIASNVMGSGMSEEVVATPELPEITEGTTSKPADTVPPVKGETITPAEVPVISNKTENETVNNDKIDNSTSMTTDSDEQEPEEQDPEETTGEDMYIHQEFNTTLGTVVGEDIHKNARIIITLLEQKEELNKEHKNVVETLKKMCQVLKKYEVSIVDGNFIGELHITFPIGEEYNGDTLTIVHLTEEGYESFVRTVKDGNVDVTVSSLSPFIILQGKVDVEKLFETTTDEEQPIEVQEVPDSGMNFVPIIAIAIVAVAGIFVFLLYKKRNNEDEE